MMWPSPKLFGVGQFVEMRLYSLALTIAKSFGYITIELLQQEIPERIKGLIVVNSISKRSYDDLIRELLYFGFLKKNKLDSTEVNTMLYTVQTGNGLPKTKEICI